MLPPGSTIGILGAGQLGKMLAEAADELGIKTHVYAPDQDPIAAQSSTYFTSAEYSDIKALQKFADSVDVITLEFENVPVAPLKSIVSLSNSSAQTKNVDFISPSTSILEITQHRLREKNMLRSLGIGTAPFMEVNSEADLQKAVETIGTPGILKTCTLGYDGKGQWKIDSREDLQSIARNLQFTDSNYIYEGFVNFTKEISVIVARSRTGEIECFDPVENTHKNHILHTTIVPANISSIAADKAVSIARKLAEELEVVGLLAVEMFVLSTVNGEEILVNEMAPRPHNSGHWTLDGCAVSQFEQAIRAVVGMPLIKPKRTCSKAVMTNLIGDDVHNLQQWQHTNAHIHIYGKKQVRSGRKMGHVTVVTS